MNKWQRAGAGAYGAIEHALDDLRHTWERLWFDRKITGEVDMFKIPEREQEQPQPSTAELFDRLFGRTAERDEGHAPERGRDERTQGSERAAQEREQDMEIER